MAEPRIVESPERAMSLAEMLKALGHPIRLRIVAILCERPRPVNDLAARLDQPQAIVSQQLRILRMAGLVEAVREAGFAHYRLAEPRLRDLVSCMEGCERNR